MSAKLGEILVRENLVTPQQLREALDYQRVNGGRLGSNLIKLGIISDDVITAVLSRQYGVPSINLDLFHIEPVIASESSIQMAIGKYYSGSTSIDIFDAAFTFETDKSNGKNGSGKNGMRSRNAAGGGSKIKVDERL